MRFRGRVEDVFPQLFPKGSRLVFQLLKEWFDASPPKHTPGSPKTSLSICSGSKLKWIREELQRTGLDQRVKGLAIAVRIHPVLYRSRQRAQLWGRIDTPDQKYYPGKPADATTRVDHRSLTRTPTGRPQKGCVQQNPAHANRDSSREVDIHIVNILTFNHITTGLDYLTVVHPEHANLLGVMASVPLKTCPSRLSCLLPLRLDPPEFSFATVINTLPLARGRSIT